MRGLGDILVQNAAKRNATVQRFSVFVEIPNDDPDATVDAVEQEIISALESCGYEMRIKREITVTR